MPWTKFDRQDDFDDPAKLGFEFSLAQIEVRAIDLQPDLFADWAPMPTAKLPDISLWGGP